MAMKFEEEEEGTPIPKGSKKGAPAIEEEDDFSHGGKKSAEIIVSEDDDCEFGDTKLMYRGDGLDRLRPAKGSTAKLRFALVLSPKPKKAFNHYIDKKGTFRCTSSDEGEGLCCKQLGKPNLQFAAVVVHYTNADPDTGKYTKEVTDTKFKIMYVSLSQTNFSDISALVQEDEAVDGFDIVMSKAENGIGYKFNRVSNECRYKKKGLTQEVKDACAKFEDGVLLTKKLGKRLNPIEWRALLSTVHSDGGEDDNGDL